MKKKIAVVGGGIVGSTAAFYLAKNQHEVTLFDDGIGQATAAAAGIISPWLSQRRNQNWYHLARTGAQFYPTLMKDLAVPTESEIYQQVGTLLFKKNQLLLDKLFSLAKERRIVAPEIGEILKLTAAEIKQKIPLLQVASPALFVSGGARVDGRLLINQLKEKFIEETGQFKSEKVTTIKKEKSKWLVITNQTEQLVDIVILAVGPWLPSLLNPLGYQVDIRPQKGQLVELKTSLDTNKWPVVMPQGESDLIPFADGKILVGATHENDQGFNLEIQPEKIKNLLTEASLIAPDIPSFEQVSVRTGTRAYTTDFLPFFGLVGAESNLYAASGLGSSGLTTGPAIGHLLAQWIENQPTNLMPESYNTQSYIVAKN